MATKPILLIVDDNPDVLGAISDDLRARYGDNHEIRAARAGSDALNLLQEAQGRGEPVALVVADQRMPRKAGQDVLVEAHLLAPSAKRVLLTLPEDADAGLQAINAGQA